MFSILTDRLSAVLKESLSIVLMLILTAVSENTDPV